MSKQSLPRELETLLRLSKPKIDAHSYETILKQITASFNWAYFLERAIATNLAGYLLPYPDTAILYFPTFVLEKIKGYQQHIRLHSMKLLDLLTDVTTALDKSKVDYAILKGCAGLLEQSYRFKERQVSDIDLLIEAEQLEAVASILNYLGCQLQRINYKSKWHQKYQAEHAPLQAYLNGLSIDVHVRLFRKGTPYQIDTRQLLKTKKELNYNNRKYYILEPNVGSLFNTLHIHKHLYFGSMFKVGGINDLDQVNFEHLASLADQWNANAQLHEMKDFWESWKNDEFQETFLGKTAWRFAAARKLTWDEKWIFLRRRIKGSFWMQINPQNYFFSIFPSKLYLNTYFGQGPYFMVWLKRTKKFFSFRTNA